MAHQIRLHATPRRFKLCSSRRPPLTFGSLRQHGGPTQLEDQNVCIASPLPSPNNLDPPFSSPSTWQVTPTIPTFIPIRLSLKACPSRMMRQTLGYKTSSHVHTVLKSVKRQVSLCTSVI